jgi:hypothetical protein
LCPQFLWLGVGEYNTRKGNKPAALSRFLTPGRQVLAISIENLDKETIMSTQFQPVIFHKHTLFLVDYDEQPYVPMKPVAEGMGLSWSSQYQKITKCGTKFNHVDIDIVASDGKQRSMLCIPLKKLNGWLFSINPEKVKPELKETIVLYQEECFTALHDYWFNGAAVNPKSGKQSPEKVETMDDLLRAISKSIKENKALIDYADIIELYEAASKMYSHAERILALKVPVEAALKRMESQTGKEIALDRKTKLEIQGDK